MKDIRVVYDRNKTLEAVVVQFGDYMCELVESQLIDEETKEFDVLNDEYQGIWKYEKGQLCEVEIYDGVDKWVCQALLN
ncbi:MULTISPECIES: hypothetical protein [Bacillus subtilis group]|uniref:hypothetical protein n=1 Tax=Bacillus subtilis group TaxID=653685 RepID=UPI0005EBEEE0|nr:MULTISPECIES: hypothetical protein [Bacillus subtilis group]AYK63106.1 hypothetical protein D9C14_17880 [Bacillus subtilis subsp. subtilis]KJR69254.1 hypothetical protein BAGR45_10385 [Bacillus velezensis]QYJ63485.1 hypothetical protein J8615_10560 [Bacillus velezensis]